MYVETRIALTGRRCGSIVAVAAEAGSVAISKEGVESVPLF